MKGGKDKNEEGEKGKRMGDEKIGSLSERTLEMMLDSYYVVIDNYVDNDN